LKFIFDPATIVAIAPTRRTASMLVCHCKGVSDRTVRDAVALGATSRRAVARACGAGTVCGGCRPVIEEIVAQSAGEADGASLRLELAPAR
jgi:bacterioferritin-associated ferredoxin